MNPRDTLPAPEWEPMLDQHGRPYVLGEIQTRTGLRVRPTELRAADIDPRDIAWALAHQCRFTGHTREFYSVAQHCANAAYYAHRANYSDELVLACLLHDASEAYLLDLPSPIKNLPEMRAFKDLEKKIQGAIESRFGLALGTLNCAQVKEIDRRLLATEARDFMHREGFNLDRVVRPYDSKFHGWSSQQAREMWLFWFEDYALSASDVERARIEYP